MKRLTLIMMVLMIFSVACTKKAPVGKFNGIYPGMSCADLDNYLKDQKIPFKKDGNVYRFVLKENAWESADVTCDNLVTSIEFDSKTGSTAKEAQAYIDAQQSLLKTFRGNRITYEEGNKIINMNNGVKLHQFADAKSGVITHFKISVDNTDGSKKVWEKVAVLLPKIGM